MTTQSCPLGTGSIVPNSMEVGNLLSDMTDETTAFWSPRTMTVGSSVDSANGLSHRGDYVQSDTGDTLLDTATTYASNARCPLGKPAYMALDSTTSAIVGKYVSDTTIMTSLSTVLFDHKPTQEEKRNLPFEVRTITVEQLHWHVIHGGAFNNIYDLKGTFMFKGKGIKTDNYIGTQTINIDLDHQTETMEECFQRVKDKPTLCYTTSSNGKVNEKTGIAEYAYRFIYVLDSVLEGKEPYKELYNLICTRNRLEYDPRASNPYQNMFGCANCQSKYTAMVYSVRDLGFEHQITANNSQEVKRCKSNNMTTTTQHNIGGSAHFIDPQFYTDFLTQDFRTIIYNYKDKLRNIQMSRIPFALDDEMMVELPSDFYEIRRSFKTEGDGKGDCKKLEYGQHRKRKLFCNLMIRRLITEDLSPTELLYELCYEMEYYIDNTNTAHLITKRDLLHIVERAMEADLEEFRQSYKRPRERMVNHRYAERNGMTNKAVSNKANAERHSLKKKERYERIGEVFDCSLSNKENLAILAEHGIKISIDTLKRFKKENGLTRGYTKRRSSES